ncbi:MAG TPA: peptidylprolyl isomerase [Acidimicrobiales bacterium]|nr:peptidylprolyl isomerase [Acidimicrobiales bacterium]
MKWLIALLLVLGGVVAYAAFAVPTNAAVVNGSAISQASLNSDVHSIAGSAEYQCYLNSNAYLSSQGSQTLPPVPGAGKGQNEGDNPTASSAFVAQYLDTLIGNELLLQVAAKHEVIVTPAQLKDARASFESHISTVMRDVAQTAQGQNPKYSCGATNPLTGQDVLATMPMSFVDDEVQFVATASALQEELAGVGASESDLMRYYGKHSAEFDTACFNAAEYTDESSAKDVQVAVDLGTPFAQATSSAAQSGSFQCAPLVVLANQLGVDMSTLDAVALNQASAPITESGNGNTVYLVLELTKRTPTPFATAKQYVSQAVQSLGTQATSVAINAAQRRASVTVNPQYGKWVPGTASVFTPLTPEKSDVLNAPANQGTVSSGSPFSG